MAGSDIASAVTGNLDSIIWSSLEPEDYRDTTMEAVADGIQGYIDDNWSILAATVGIVTLTVPPPPTIPFGESVTVDLIVALASILKSELLDVSGTEPLNAMTSFFDAIDSWLNTPVWLSPVTGGTLLSPLAGPGTVTFPMASMAASCFAEMSGSKPDDRDVAWEIIGTHIFNGLMANTVSHTPLSTIGIHPSGPYVGTTTSVLTF